jgi:rubredoxin
MCPECGSDDVRVVHYDFGRCPETGYHDAGDRYSCGECGAYGDASELKIEEDAYA